MTDKRYSNLWIINSDGTDHRPLTTGNRSDSSPRWSPDGTRLAYLSDADGKQQIYIRWMDTGQTARITNLEQAPDSIAWSPDGKMLSFSSLVLGKGPHIADLPAAPSGAKWADPPAAYDRLVYRFNGSVILNPATCSYSLWTVKAAPRAKSPTAISRMAATSSAPIALPGRPMAST